MKILDLKQGSPEWHAHRRNHFNASDAPAMMGFSKYKTRTDLVKEYATGIINDVDEATQRRFDEGHRIEALARPLAEEIIGDELYPVTGSEGSYSASFDGLTLDESILFEHKTLNDKIRKDIQNGQLGIEYRVQIEHQMMVSGAKKALFMATNWDGEECIEKYSFDYTSDPVLREQIAAGWAQFVHDVANYSPIETEIKPLGKSPDTLPALRIEITGAVTASNLSEFKATALAVFDGINKNLQTDQDFADAEKTVKWCEDVESRLKAAKEHAQSQASSIDQLFKAIDDIAAESRRVRLQLEKDVKTRKELIKANIVQDGILALRDHIDGLNAIIGNPYMPIINADFAGAIKGKKTVESIRVSIDQVLTNAKIESNAISNVILKNLNLLEKKDNAFDFLFKDIASIVTKPVDDFANLVNNRVLEYQLSLKNQAQKPEPILQPKIKQSETGKMITLGEISKKLGFNVTADFMLSLGFMSTKDRTSNLYPEALFKNICAALISHINQVSDIVEAIAL